MEQNNSIAHVPVVCRDHANELRRMARKVGHPAGDVPAVMHAAAAHIENLERRLREAEARVAELEAERAEREKQEPIFWYRPFCDGKMYERPVHNESITGKWCRDEKPDGWVPLIAKPIQPTRGEG